MRPPIEVGQRVRKTVHYPDRGAFCPAVSWTWEGTVHRLLDLEENAKAQGAGWHARQFRGEYYVYLRDVTLTPDPQTPLRRPTHEDEVVLVGDGPWERMD